MYKTGKKMKALNYFLLLTAIFTMSEVALAQETSLDNYYGSWEDNSSWSGGWTDGTPETLGLPETNANITIRGYIEVATAPAPAPGSGDVLTFSSNKDAYDFIVNDTLVVYGDVDFANKAMNLRLGTGAVFIVFGNLKMNNKIDIASSGTLVVTGNFNKTGSQGSFTGSGNVYAGSYSGDAESTLDAGDGDSSFPLGQLSDDGFGDIEDFIGSGGSSPLPVELLRPLSATAVNGTVKLTWSTASELNNAYFTIEQSTDGIEYFEIAQVVGAGNSTTIVEYDYEDSRPAFGVTYYRLKQTDFDGATEIFSPVSVTYSSFKDTALRFKNPARYGETIQIITNADPAEGLTIAVYDLNGNLLVSGTFEYSEYQLQADLKPGIYLVKVSSVNNEQSARLVVQ